MRLSGNQLRGGIRVATLYCAIAATVLSPSSPVEGGHKDQPPAEKQDSSSKAVKDSVQALDRLGHRIGKETGKAAESAKKLFTDRFKTSPAQSK